MSSLVAATTRKFDSYENIVKLTVAEMQQALAERGWWLPSPTKLRWHRCCSRVFVARSDLLTIEYLHSKYRQNCWGKSQTNLRKWRNTWVAWRMSPIPPTAPTWNLRRSYNSSRGYVRSWRVATKVSRLLKGGYPIKPMLHKGSTTCSTQFWGTSRERRVKALRTYSSEQSRSSAPSWACQWNWPVHAACPRRPSPVTTPLPLPPD